MAPYILGEGGAAFAGIVYCFFADSHLDENAASRHACRRALLPLDLPSSASFLDLLDLLDHNGEARGFSVPPGRFARCYVVPFRYWQTPATHRRALQHPDPEEQLPPSNRQQLAIPSPSIPLLRQKVAPPDWSQSVSAEHGAPGERLIGAIVGEGTEQNALQRPSPPGRQRRPPQQSAPLAQQAPAP